MDKIEVMRRHVASYKTMTRHRQNCLDLCDELEMARAEIERLSKILVAARWVDIHVAAERIPGLIDRQHFGALRAALKEYDGAEITGDSDEPATKIGPVPARPQTEKD